MVSNGSVRSTDGIQEEDEPATMPSRYEARNQPSFQASTSRRGLLEEDNQRNKYPATMTDYPTRSSFFKFGSPSRLPSPSSKFQRIAEEREEISRSVPSPVVQSSSKHFRIPLIGKVNWVSLWELSKEWIRDPMNMILFAWITCVAISGAILFLVLTGMLNHALPRKSQRDTWFEVNNQILNALFTLMCLYHHPKRFYYFALLCRWRPEDVLRLRKVYCKNGTYKPNEWMHMMVVVLLLHVNCFAQYALCALNLGYRRSKRPAIGVGLSLSVSFLAAAIANVYNNLSPLGRDYEIAMDQEAQGQIATPVDHSTPARLRLKSLENKYSFMTREDHRVAESTPHWVGGLFDFWDDISLAYLSIFCSCCVFGWNMDRLGFGNMYVHISTFLLFCLAPFFIFNLAAINIDNEAIREALGITGFVLCIFGLLYGGFWRIQMRKKFDLPGSTFCCGKPAVTDCFQWLCCCSCSLAQEVRTGDFYDVVEDKFYLKQARDGSNIILSPLPRESGHALFRSRPNSPSQDNSNHSPYKMENSANPIGFSVGFASEGHLPMVEEGSSVGGKEDIMEPPVPSVVQREQQHNLSP